VPLSRIGTPHPRPGRILENRFWWADGDVRIDERPTADPAGTKDRDPIIPEAKESLPNRGEVVEALGTLVSPSTPFKKIERPAEVVGRTPLLRRLLPLQQQLPHRHFLVLHGLDRSCPPCPTFNQKNPWRFGGGRCRRGV